MKRRGAWRRCERVALVTKNTGALGPQTYAGPATGRAYLEQNWMESETAR